jgi:excisionase family DNA binding protein
MAGSDEQLLSLEDVARRLQVSDQTVRRWIKSGKLAAYKPGLEWRIKPSDLEEFLRAREVRPKAPSRSPFEPSLLNGLEEERRRAEYVPRVWPRIKLLERAAEQWQRFTDEGLYDLRSLSLEDLQTIDAVSLNIVINHSQDVHELKQACTLEQLERLKQAEKSYFDANLGFWARVENTLARQRVPDLAERRAQLQARRTEMERLADLA